MGSLPLLVEGGILPTSPVPRPCPCQARRPGRESGRDEIAHQPQSLSASSHDEVSARLLDPHLSPALLGPSVMSSRGP